MKTECLLTKKLIYQPLIQDALPRVFSMLDREPISMTFGCADRVFWSWKFIDFPGARFQEIACLLAEFSLNPHLLPDHSIQIDTLLSWTKASIHFWSTLQHQDGSFDEAYPYERSLAATAFTGFYVGQAFLKTKHSYTPADQNRLIAAFKSTGDWLCLNDEHHGILSNHLAAAAAALDVIADITLEDKFINRRDYFVNRIIQHQSEEGWYEEYGGADPGYQTHTTFYLACIWLKTKNKILLSSLEKSIQYFWHFIHTDGSIGGEYASRNTRFFMPAGFEILSSEISEAASVAHTMRIALKKKQVIGLDAMDTYNVLPLINNYLFAQHYAKVLDTKTLLPLPNKTIGIKRYTHSGHLVIIMPAYQLIISTSKGGALSAFSATSESDNLLYSNSGIAIEFVKGIKASSQGLGCSTIKRLDETHITISSQFTAVNQMLMSPLKLIAFRLTSLLSIPFPSFAYHLKNLLVKVLVRRKKICHAQLLRTITWHDHGIAIKDNISLNKPKKVKNIWVGGRFSAIHMGSSRYFEWQELTHPTLSSSLPIERIHQLNTDGNITLNYDWNLTNTDNQAY